MSRWFAVLNDLVGGWAVGNRDKPMSEYGSDDDYPLADMMNERDARAVAALLTLHDYPIYGGAVRRDWRYRVRPEDEPEHVSAEPRVPAYSTKIEAAMTLLDSWHGDWEIRRQNDHYKVTLYEPSMQGDEWDASLPLAICRIRLRAAGWPLAASHGQETGGTAP